MSRIDILKNQDRGRGETPGPANLAREAQNRSKIWDIFCNLVKVLTKKHYNKKVDLYKFPFLLDYHQDFGTLNSYLMQFVFSSEGVANWQAGAKKPNISPQERGPKRW